MLDLRCLRDNTILQYFFTVKGLLSFHKKKYKANVKKYNNNKNNKQKNQFQVRSEDALYYKTDENHYIDRTVAMALIFLSSWTIPHQI